MTTNRIAILGWGSLLWDFRRDFDAHHENWQDDGPSLPIEFCRVSESRRRALTLVIDDAHGHDCTVAYAISKRADARDATYDLQSREGTSLDKIRCLDVNAEVPAKGDKVGAAIWEWAKGKQLAFVVWTALPNNFKKETGLEFSVEAAIHHVQQLPAEGKALAAEYVWRAPIFVDTPLRRALQTAPWFNDPRRRGLTIAI